MNRPRFNLCVFAGSRLGAEPVYTREARLLGSLCAQRGWGIVYGGGGQVLMGELADAALQAGGYVEGVIPDDMVQREWAHRCLSELHIVETMHQRKQRMHDRSDAFVALPGGIGTLDELCEALAWQKLEIHKKPVAVMDVDGFYKPLLRALEQISRAGFYSEPDFERLWVVDSASSLVHRLSAI